MKFDFFKHSDVKGIKTAFCSISIYRNLLKHSALKKLQTLVEYISHEDSDPDFSINLYNEFFFELANSGYMNDLKSLVIDEIILDENIFSLQLEQKSAAKNEEFILTGVKNDLFHLQSIANMSPSKIKACILQQHPLSEYQAKIIEKLVEWNTGEKETSRSIQCSSQYSELKKLLYGSYNWSENFSVLSDFYNQAGSGIFARYRAFIWEYSGTEGFLSGIDKPDPIALTDFIGYESERAEVLNNTLQFLKGYPANNMLLYGDRGTGKSSTVKAMANEYFSLGLRIVEVPKNRLIDFPKIIKHLENRNYKFIIFVDDLAFEDNEENYTALKAVLEGGLAKKPSNVLIYATSNRRHLVKEKFSDRTGLQYGNQEDEIRAADTMQEKLSLADRFGITVVFSSPDKFGYLEIVEGIAKSRELKIDKDQLHKEALKWELWYNGRSPRTARQFVDWLEGKAAE